MSHQTLEEEAAPEEIIPGVARALSPMVRRILATNPGAETGLGTNTYLVGIDEIAVIDPGPLDEEHLRSIAGCGGDLIRWIIVTNGDEHHAGAAQELKKRTGAEILAMADIERDREVKHDDQIVATEFRLTIKHLPGPSRSNIGLFLEDERTLFSGDLIVDGATVMFEPPEADMADVITSLESLRKLRLRRIAPAHGYLVEDAKPAVEAQIAEHQRREQRILDIIGDETLRLEEVAAALFGDVLDDDALGLSHGMVHAHLLKLKADGAVKGSKNWARA